MDGKSPDVRLLAGPHLKNFTLPFAPSISIQLNHILTIFSFLRDKKPVLPFLTVRFSELLQIEELRLDLLDCYVSDFLNSPGKSDS